MNAQKADFYTRLAVLTDAGLPLARAVKSLEDKAPRRWRRVLDLTLEKIERGLPLYRALPPGIVTPLERTLLEAGRESGRETFAYRQLGDFFTRVDAQTRRTRSRLALPALLFSLGVVIVSMLGYIQDRYDLAGFIWRAVLGLMLVGMLMFALVRLVSSTGHSPIGALVPVFSTIARRRAAHRAVYALSLMTASGVPILGALPRIIASTTHPALRKSLTGSLRRLKGGASIADAFADSALLTTEDRYLLSSGEESGTLDDMLARIERRQADSLEDLENQVMFWVPKLVYFVFLLWAAYHVVHSHLAILAGLPD